MKTNLGNTDRFIRLMIAVAIVVLYWLSILPGSWALAILIVSAVLFLTSLVGYCPLYGIFGMNTNRHEAKR